MSEAARRSSRVADKLARFERSASLILVGGYAGATRTAFPGAVVVKRALMVAYHFPPMNVSSGIQRNAAFCPVPAGVQLGTGGSDCASARVFRYFTSKPCRGAIGSAGATRFRARCSQAPVNTGAHIRAGWHFRPLGELVAGRGSAGLALIRKLNTDVMWSTFPSRPPIYRVHAAPTTGIPWVADFPRPHGGAGRFCQTAPARCS